MSTESSRPEATDLLRTWTFSQLPAAAAQWLEKALSNAHDKRAIDIAFGLAPRKTGRDALALDSKACAEADALIPGWQPERLRIDEAARLLIAAAALEHEPDTLGRLIRHADVDEQCAIYRGLCLFGDSVDLHELVGRGLRTHATPVFESIAHYNPWVVTQFDEHRWNHLILKAMFMEVSLWPIMGFDDRRNPELARMALDFAAERHAADRSLPAELFRCVAPYANLSDIDTYLPATPWQDTVETRAASLALLNAEDAAISGYIKQHSPHVTDIQDGTLSWHNHIDAS